MGGWPEVALESVCEINVGRTPSRHEKSYWENGIHPWVSISDMTRARYISKTKECISEKARIECNMKPVPEGTVLISFKLSIGKVSFSDREIYTNEAIAALPIIDLQQLDPHFLARALEAIDFNDVGNRAVMGLTLNKASLKQIKIPLPPLEEQKRIAAILDQADDLRRKRQHAVDRLNQLGQAIFHEMFGANEEISNAPLGEIADLKRGPFGGALKKEIFVTEGFKVYEQGNAINKNYLYGKYFIDHRKYKEMASFSVEPNDLIVSCSGTLGQTYRIPHEAPEGIINQALLRIRVKDDVVSSRYLESFFMSPQMQLLFSGFARGTGLQNFPPMSEVRLINVPLPTMEKQLEFFQRMDQIGDVKGNVSRVVADIDSLFASIQHRAFTGKL